MKKLIILGIIAVLMLNVISIVSAQEKVFYMETEELGMVEITIDKLNFLESILQSFSARFLQTTAVTNEYVDIEENIFSATCELDFWRIKLFKDNALFLTFNFDEEDLEIISGGTGDRNCNFKVSARFSTDQIGTYSLKSEFRRRPGGEIITSDGSNTVRITQSTGKDCEWQDSIADAAQPDNGFRWIRDYKDVDLTDEERCEEFDDLFKTKCDFGYHIEGREDGFRESDWGTTRLDCSADGGVNGDDGISKCSDCGQGIANTCDQLECESLGDCTFIDNLILPNECVPSGDDNGVPSGPKEPITWTEYYSKSTEEILENNIRCSSTSQCSSKEGFKVECVQETIIQTRFFEYHQSQCRNRGGLVGKVLERLQRWGFGLDLCKYEASAVNWIAQAFKGDGVCLAESENTFSGLWEDTLKLVGGFGLPEQYVVIITIISLVFIASILIRVVL